MIDLGLERIGVDFDRSLTETYLRELEAFYLGDGWYRDGNVPRVDHYIPFAMHFYGLIYAALAQSDGDRKQRFREWARLFAPNIRHWFADDGGTLAFGRSMTYRFACAGFWAALAFADEEALPWGEVKGYYLRHLRWWARHPITERDGVLSDRVRLRQPAHVGKLQLCRGRPIGPSRPFCRWRSTHRIRSGRPKKRRAPTSPSRAPSRSRAW